MLKNLVCDPDKPTQQLVVVMLLGLVGDAAADRSDFLRKREKGYSQGGGGGAAATSTNVRRKPSNR
jgi:hypothetical protein